MGKYLQCWNMLVSLQKSSGQEQLRDPSFGLNPSGLLWGFENKILTWVFVLRHIPIKGLP